MIDRRALSTRNSIARAIIAMGQRRPLESITVRQLAAEAGISRSTFYAHFNSLEHYLTQSYALMLERGARLSGDMPGCEAKPLAVRAILDHVAAQAGYAAATKDSRFRPLMARAGEQRLRQVAASNLARLRPDLSEVERDQAATFIAGGFMAMLHAWIANGLRETPEMVNTAFERLSAAVVERFAVNGRLPSTQSVVPDLPRRRQS
jgi:AcrR family transcriptional regulator